jgi:hypothetical protein
MHGANNIKIREAVYRPDDLNQIDAVQLTEPVHMSSVSRPGSKAHTHSS